MVHHNMAIKIGTEPCSNSSSGRGCVYKPIGTPAIGDGKVKHIWSCRRCIINIETLQNLKNANVAVLKEFMNTSQ